MLTGQNGILARAAEAKRVAGVEQDIEEIKLTAQEIITEDSVNGGNGKITIESLEEKYSEDISAGKVSITGTNDTTGSDTYRIFITTENGNYGIKNDNSVEELEDGIYNKYIYVTEALEETPTYSFKNTITQKDVDGEMNSQNTTYEIVGISTEEDGEYVQSTLAGKSGELSIVGDIQDCNFDYKLTGFFMGDEVFYVKIKIGDTYKFQKLTVVQGDCVKYEECFVGIQYTGDWELQDEPLVENGKIMHASSSKSHMKISSLKGERYDYNEYISNCEENRERFFVTRYTNGSVHGIGVRQGPYVDNNEYYDVGYEKASNCVLSENLEFIKIDENNNIHGVEITTWTNSYNFDCIWIYKN